MKVQTQAPHAKIYTLEQFLPLRKQLSESGLSLVFTNGCFDLLHPGHADYLEKARALGDRLLVAINSDESVSALKGDARPIIPQEERAEILGALECVDFVIIFPEPTPREIIQALLPDVLVKGSDWAPDEIVGRSEVEAAGGHVVSIEFLPGFSTTAILETISRNYGKK
ncbi:MAG: D-glycero-beta-D-manno-heptose 1-phosphate adenylyltransferase [Acidobacteriia bacterium]|nr:D-glycero-beta-D-manno-heptose 1-phosphate adenylyltransferase [Terriglobia bacterium]